MQTLGKRILKPALGRLWDTLYDDTNFGVRFKLFDDLFVHLYNNMNTVVNTMKTEIKRITVKEKMRK